MSQSSLEVPAAVSFEQAIALTESLLSQIETGTLSETDIATVISALVKTENGARGFFVTYLTSASSAADSPSDAVIEALRSSPEIVSELLVKNIAMSTAQAIFHRRQQKEDMAEGSDRVHRRTKKLIQLVDLPQVRDRTQQLIESAKTGEGTYKGFLERWNYDPEQKQAICQALEQIN
ncbi:hypothetical protein H6G17_21000 [Chroococcidiopsis sp. FACHB-1243]|uniref:hypothetical protein n=1 Tax=Chroococcidiopsis sp. [FACHB-1243] TaxID=2692781 RepID=UPI00178767F1|nr:hypothetical protein [Chroococcidiopsis sp. [FACHB-1243]]MBD2307952.1 hypothetical protein [Chroococcidiopsis sp. [FACHB-1243]]